MQSPLEATDPGERKGLSPPPPPLCSLSQAAGTFLVSLVSSLSPTSNIQSSFVFHRSRWESILSSEIESSFLLKKAVREVLKNVPFFS